MIRKVLIILRDFGGVPARFSDIRDEITIRFGRPGEHALADAIRIAGERGLIAAGKDGVTDDDTYLITPKGRSNVP